MSVSWTNAALVVAAMVVIVILGRWHADKKNPYDVRDLLMDHTTGKAGLDKHILLWFAGLSGWVVVTWTLHDKNVETLLLGVLGIFIVQRTASKAIDSFAPKADPPPETDIRPLERK
jgi:hypothetical protein